MDPALAPPAPRLDPTDLGLWRGDSAPSPGPALALPRPGGEDPFKQLDTPQSLDNDFDYTLLTHRAPGESGYFRIDIRPRRTLQNLRTLPKDVVFLLDSSGSISRNWLQEVVAGVTDALDTLNPGDRFNIVVFKDTPHFLSSDRIRSVDSASLAEAKRFLLKAESGGGTDVNQALSRLLVRDVAADRVHYLILISDGVPTRGVKDTRELINAITRDNDLVAGIFCVGVGRKTDRALLDYLAYRNRGSSVFCERIEEVRPSIRDLAGRLRYPIIKDLRFAVVGVDGGEVYPKDLPNIHQSDSISIYGRYNKPGPFTMRLTGHNGQKTLDFTFKQEIPPIADHLPQIADNWAFWKLHHLYSERLRLGASPAIDRQIEALRAKHSLR
jgi:Ca-activated chloride channel family protein